MSHEHCALRSVCHGGDGPCYFSAYESLRRGQERTRTQRSVLQMVYDSDAMSPLEFEDKYLWFIDCHNLDSMEELIAAFVASALGHLKVTPALVTL